MKKVIWTLNANGNYAPEITDLTYPLLKRYAHKIEADFRVITERKFPDFPVVYEKLQIYELGKNIDWNIYIDSDALIHPDLFDVTDHLSKDTVCHTGQDMAGNRWRYDKYFRRNGRHIGSCNWFTIGSDWCIDLWKPLDDLTLQQAIDNIFPIQHELAETEFKEIEEDGKKKRIEVKKQVITRDHLIDDYTLSRNIAKYGLKFDTIPNIQARIGDKAGYFWHLYTITVEEKIKGMKEVLKNWRIDY